MMRWQAFNARVLVEIRAAIRRKPTRLPNGGRCDWLFGRHKSDECRHAGETGLYLRNQKGVGTCDKKVREVVIDLDVDAET